MKKRILMVSLLRLGDFILQKGLIDYFSSKYGIENIDFLTLDETAKLNFLYPLNRFYSLPYKLIQDILVDQSRNLQSAYFLVDDLISELNENEYYMVVNLSHTILSARMCAFIKSKEYHGAAINKEIRSEGYTYLNEVYAEGKTTALHYAEALAFSLDIKDRPNSSLAWPDKSGNKNIYIQLFSSDDRKNLPLSLLQTQIEQHTGAKILIAPFEEEKAKALLPANFWQRLVVSRLSELPSLLQSASLLISPDTLTLHLAADMGIRCEAYFFGPANIYRTFPLIEGARVFSSPRACYPCEHRGACSQPAMLCKEDLASFICHTVCSVGGRLSLIGQNRDFSDFCRVLAKYAILDGDRQDQREQQFVADILNVFGPERVVAYWNKIREQTFVLKNNSPPLVRLRSQSENKASAIVFDREILRSVPWLVEFGAAIAEGVDINRIAVNEILIKRFLAIFLSVGEQINGSRTQNSAKECAR